MWTRNSFQHMRMTGIQELSQYTDTRKICDIHTILSIIDSTTTHIIFARLCALFRYETQVHLLNTSRQYIFLFFQIELKPPFYILQQYMSDLCNLENFYICSRIAYNYVLTKQFCFAKLKKSKQFYKTRIINISYDAIFL